VQIIVLFISEHEDAAKGDSVENSVVTKHLCIKFEKKKLCAEI